jgi:hypothetical protein
MAAPSPRAAQLRSLLLDELRHGEAELRLTRSGYGHPVAVAIAVGAAGLVAVAPVAPSLRADPGAAGDRAWRVVAARVGALVEGAPPARGPGGRPVACSAPVSEILAGEFEGWLALALPVPSDGEAAELAAIAFDEEQLRTVDRLRARAFAVPESVLESARDMRDPIGPSHPLRVAELVARLGGRPADEASVAEHEDAIAELLAFSGSASRPHEEQDPGLRIARRMVQRLAGMGKWGGYHTSVDHLPRGFAGNDRALAVEVGRRLIAAGVLLEKPSVGQRHVYLNPRRAGEIYALIDTGALPAGLSLP